MHETAYRQFLELEREHWWFRGRRRIFSRTLAAHRPQRRPLRILDAGCGAGGMLEELERQGSPIAVDLSWSVLAHCRRRGPWPAVAADAACLPFADQRIDIVGLFDTIEHLRDDTQGLREAFRVLRPGGIALVSVPAYQFLYADNDRVAGHQRRYTRKRLRRELAAAGLEVLHASYYNSALLPLIVPAILTLKIKERLWPVPIDHKKTNLSYRLPGWLNRLLAAILYTEARIVPWIALPFGHSLIAVARRPREAP